jgi:hypothetical protein
VKKRPRQGERKREKRAYKSSELLPHSVSNAREHGRPSREHYIFVQVLADVDVTHHDRVESVLMDASGLHAQQGGLEEGLGAP